jgi:hypothetical protein
VAGAEQRLNFDSIRQKLSETTEAQTYLSLSHHRIT